MTEAIGAHPEVTFSVLAGKKVPAGKTTLLGQLVRIGIVSRYFGFDVTPWLLATELRTKVAVDNCLDALAMLVVANDWADASRRRMIPAADGRAAAWDGRLDRLIAVPYHERLDPPLETLSADEALALAVAR